MCYDQSDNYILTHPNHKSKLVDMPTRTDSIETELPRGPGQHWRFNGPLVDADPTADSWGLADDLVRLQIGDANKDGDESHGTMRTPPKAKLSSSVSQLTQNSPLDSSSNTSLGSSPQTPDHQLNIAHSRGSSTDSTTSGSHDSSPGAQNALLSHSLDNSEGKERPHSFSGGLSTADLRRLQQIDGSSDDLDPQLWSTNQHRDSGALPNEQLQYPTLTQVYRPQPLSHPQSFDYRNTMQSAASDRDEPQIDYSLSQRYSSVPQGLSMTTAPPPQPFAGRSNNAAPNVNYRQLLRTFPQQSVVPSPPHFSVGHHTSHLSLGSAQPMFEMMTPNVPLDNNPAVARVQQQHNIFRPGHHHSASDPSAMRDAATLALFNGNIPSLAPGIYPPAMHPSITAFPNQYYGVDVASQLASRYPTQFSGTYPVPSQTPNLEATANTPTGISSSQSGPSANNRKLGLYKTELCRSWEEKGTCRYGTKCQFAHGEEELRKVARHPKVRSSFLNWVSTYVLNRYIDQYKTEICRVSPSD